MAGLIAALFAALFFAAGTTEAKTLVSPTGAAGVTFGPGRVDFGDGASIGSKFTGRTVSAAAGGAAAIAEAYGVQIGGAGIGVVATRLLPPIALATAAVAAVATAGDAVNIATGNKPSGLGIEPLSCILAGRQWNCRETKDAKADPSGVGIFYYIAGGDGVKLHLSPSPEGTCGGWAGEVFAYQGQTGTWAVQGGCRVTYSNGNSAGFWPIQQETGQPGTAPKTCDAAIDAFNPAWSVMAGSAPDQNGKCRTGRYNQGNGVKTDAEIEVEAKGYFERNPDAGKALIEALIADGVPFYAPEPRKMSGPATAYGYEGNTVKLTDENGVPVLERIKTVPKVDYVYNGNAVGFTTTTTTTTTREKNGVVTVVSEETTTGPRTTVPQPGESEKEEQQDIDLCKGNTDKLACATLGKPSEDKPVWETKSVTPYAPENLGFGGSCPAPIMLNFGAGVNTEWSMQPYCDIAGWIRLLVLAFTSLSAAYLIIEQTTKT